jgi:hypothetical protein
VYLELVVRAFTVRVQGAYGAKRTGASAPMMTPAALGNAYERWERRISSARLKLESIKEGASGGRTGNNV